MKLLKDNHYVSCETLSKASLRPTFRWQQTKKNWETQESHWLVSDQICCVCKIIFNFTMAIFYIATVFIIINTLALCDFFD